MVSFCPCRSVLLFRRTLSPAHCWHSRTRLQRNFVFVVLIDCALAKLLAGGSIVVSEIFVFTRAIEDVVDLLLIRSRSESELATLLTEVEKLRALEGVWSRSKEARRLPCRVGGGAAGEGAVGSPSAGVVLRDLQYSRGTASVSVDHLVIKPGIYAVTGGEIILHVVHHVLFCRPSTDHVCSSTDNVNC